MQNRIPVDSSVIAAVAYSSDAALDVEFTSGARYRYFAVRSCSPSTVISTRGAVSVTLAQRAPA
jgi:hypothetical protein